jgi:hypothetical protein
MTPSGISTSVTSVGLETPDMIELRKRKTQIESDMESMAGGDTPALFKILPEKASSIGVSMMGSSKVYDLSSAKKVLADPSGFTSGIDLTLNPDELDMATDALQSKLDQQLNSGDMEDLEKQAKKRAAGAKKQQQTSSSTTSSTNDKDKNKKYKEFKF